MILPSKHLSHDRALLTIGGQILKLLVQPQTVSALWEMFCRHNQSVPSTLPKINYDWFMLSLTLLYAMDIIELDRGIIQRRRP